MEKHSSQKMLILPSDQMITCPLDEAHRIRKERMQFHLVKCLKNHKLLRKIKCPWNPLHIIDKFEWENHWRRECENMPAAMEFICQTEEPRDVASVPVNTIRPVFESGEDWDAEPCPVGTYDPFKNAEGKPVYRSMVGLSKAKKKAWIQSERKRHQELEANGPLQLHQLGKSSQAENAMNVSAGPLELRQPRKKAVALSADASILEDLNASKLSEDTDKKSKLKRDVVNLRKPHAPSPAMSMKAVPVKPKNANDETSLLNASVVSGLPNLRDSRDLNSDAVSMISDMSCTSARRADIDKIRKLLEKSFVSNNGVNETDDDLTQRLANLTTMEKSIQDEKAALLQEMSKYVPKLVNLTTPKGTSILDNGRDRAVASNEDATMPSLVVGKAENKFANPIGKCAATFSGPKKIANAPSAGRGTIVDFAAFKRRAPGKENAGGNTTHKSASSNSSEIEIDSAFGYEENNH